ncbi:MAG: hypothetical protein MUC79_16275 [Thiobacillaceae bacterium]|nr:hypothetical protein [Thiobacillaceae bacterium]
MPVWMILAGLLACAPALATEVRIPALAGGKASVRLVYQGEQARQVMGFDGPEWATAYQGLALTAAIAVAGAAGTCYLVSVSLAKEVSASWCITVPDSGSVQELADLIGVEVPAP